MDKIATGINLNTKSILIDLGGILLVYFLPEISNLVNIPLYLFEPMRVIVIVALIHTLKQNTYLLAILLPVLSYLFSSHPSIIKTIIVSGELLLNIFLYFYLLTKFKTNKFLLMSISIVVSKFAYYVIKFISIKLSLLTGNLIATPIKYQIAIIILLSGYIYFVNILSLNKQTVK